MTAFVPCPACGGPIHPIAGRCKHCKADLVAHREAEARARRAAQQAMRDTARSAPPPPPASSSGRAPSPAPAGGSGPTPAPHRRAQTPPPSLAPQVVYADPSPWSRRWPLLVSAVALVAILVSLFFLLHSSNGEAEPLGHESSSNAPHIVPDRMPSPNLPQPQMPNIPDPDLAPQPLDPSGGGGPAPRAWHTAPDPGMFSVALVETVCAKLDSCGISDDFSSVLCQEMAKGASNPMLDAKVKSGECTYDRAAATACLQAVSNMSCDMKDADDVAGWLSQASGMVDCAGAFTCK